MWEVPDVFVCTLNNNEDILRKFEKDLFWVKCMNFTRNVERGDYSYSNTTERDSVYFLM